MHLYRVGHIGFAVLEDALHQAGQFVGRGHDPSSGG